MKITTKTHCYTAIIFKKCLHYPTGPAAVAGECEMKYAIIGCRCRRALAAITFRRDSEMCAVSAVAALYVAARACSCAFSAVYPIFITNPITNVVDF